DADQGRGRAGVDPPTRDRIVDGRAVEPQSAWRHRHAPGVSRCGARLHGGARRQDRTSSNRTAGAGHRARPTGVAAFAGRTMPGVDRRKRRMTRKLTRRRVLAGSATALAASGWISSAQSAPEPAKITPELIEAAKKEGKVVWYTSVDLALAEKVAKLFETPGCLPSNSLATFSASARSTE